MCSEDSLEGWFHVDGEYAGRLVYFVQCILCYMYVVRFVYSGGMYKGRLYCPADV